MQFLLQQLSNTASGNITSSSSPMASTSLSSSGSLEIASGNNTSPSGAAAAGLFLELTSSGISSGNGTRMLTQASAWRSTRMVTRRVTLTSP
eukprot:4363963-Pyramimonas_sp.AAC.1